MGVDAGYTQQDVIQMAECLTGWTIHEPRKDPEFFFDEKIHGEGKKVVMGQTFNYGGEKDGEEALKMLAANPRDRKIYFHRARAPLRFRQSAAGAYRPHGEDVSIDKRRRHPQRAAHHDLFAGVLVQRRLSRQSKNALRAGRQHRARSEAEVTITLPLSQWVGRMGEPLYQCQPPTGYSDKAETWVNTGALLNRLNFALAFAGDKMGGATVDLNAMLGEEAAKDPNALSRARSRFSSMAKSRQPREQRWKRA